MTFLPMAKPLPSSTSYTPKRQWTSTLLQPVGLGMTGERMLSLPGSSQALSAKFQQVKKHIYILQPKPLQLSSPSTPTSHEKVKH